MLPVLWYVSEVQRYHPDNVHRNAEQLASSVSNGEAFTFAVTKALGTTCCCSGKTCTLLVEVGIGASTVGSDVARSRLASLNDNSGCQRDCSEEIEEMHCGKTEIGLVYREKLLLVTRERPTVIKKSAGQALLSSPFTIHRSTRRSLRDMARSGNTASGARMLLDG